VSTDNPGKLVLRSELQDDSALYYCSGRLTVETAAELKDTVKPVMPHKRRVTLDLQDLTQMDSSGLGAIVALYITSKRENCELRVVNYSPAIRKLLSMSNLLSLFESYGSCGTRMS